MSDEKKRSEERKRQREARANRRIRREQLREFERLRRRQDGPIRVRRGAAPRAFVFPDFVDEKKNSFFDEAGRAFAVQEVIGYRTLRGRRIPIYPVIPRRRRPRRGPPAGPSGPEMPGGFDPFPIGGDGGGGGDSDGESDGGIGGIGGFVDDGSGLDRKHNVDDDDSPPNLIPLAPGSPPPPSALDRLPRPRIVNNVDDEFVRNFMHDIVYSHCNFRGDPNQDVADAAYEMFSLLYILRLQWIAQSIFNLPAFSPNIYVQLRMQGANGSWRTLGTLHIPYNPLINFPPWSHIRAEFYRQFSDVLEIFRSRYDDEPWTRITDLHMLVSLTPGFQGSCDSFEHVRHLTIPQDSGHTLNVSVLSPKSEQGSCAVVCLINWYKRKYKHEPEYQYPLIPESNPVFTLHTITNGRKYATMNDLDILSVRFEMEICVFDVTMQLIHRTPVGYKRKCRLMLDKSYNHYFLILSDNIRVEQSTEHSSKWDFRCYKCNTIKRSNHRCNETDVKEYRRRISSANEELRLLETKHRDDDEQVYEKLKSNVFEHNRHILLVGPAGAGKSVNIRLLRKYAHSKGLKEEEFVVVSTTGVSAINIEGQVFHSFFGIGCMRDNHQKLMERLLRNEKLKSRIKKVKVLVIDEISMMGSTPFIFVDKLCKFVRQNSTPFGGIQLILTGDFLQLPPVEEPLYVFETDLWSEIEERLQIIYMSTTFGRRYKDRTFADLMSRIRRCVQTPEDIELLKTREFSLESCLSQNIDLGLAPTILFPLKSQVTRHNKVCMDNLRGSEIILVSEDNMKIPKNIAKNLPPKNLVLKIGAQVMCTSNKWISEGIGNGSNGVVVHVMDHVVEVYFPSINKTLPIQHVVHDYRVGHTLYQRKQFPLILSWALTIHKAQGKTLDSVIIDAGTSNFAPSQIYVAMSRTIALNRLFLCRFSSSNITLNPRALNFDRWCSNWSEMGSHYPQDGRQEIITSFCKGNYLTSQLFQIKDTVTSAITFQPKKPYEELIFQKSLFYDYETYFDTEKKIEVPYYNFIKVYLQGKPVQTHEICSLCDPSIDVAYETYKFIMNLATQLKDECISKHGMHEHKGIWKYLEAPLYLCAYNGSGFDFHFYMKELLKSKEHAERFESMTTMKGSKLIAFQLWDTYSQTKALVTHDIFNITGCSLANAARDFINNKDLDKDVFPHLWVNRANLQHAREHEHVQLRIHDFPEKMQPLVAEKKLNLQQYAFHSNLHEYGKMDVVVMIEVYKKMEELTQNAVHTGILRFITLSKLTWYGFLYYLDNKYLQTGSYKNKNRYHKRYTKIYRTSIAIDNEIKECIIGGKCYPRIKQYDSPDSNKPYEEINDYYVYADIVSMYVGIMIKYDMPFGLETHLTKQEEISEFLSRSNTWDPLDTKTPMCVMKITFSLNPHELEPCIGRKYKEGSTQKLRWDLTERTQWVTSIDFYLILRNQGNITKVHEIYFWSERGPIFKDWVSKTFVEKQRAAREGRTAAKQYYKTAGNGCYGSSLQRTFNDVTIFVKDLDDLCRFHDDYNWVDTINYDTWKKGEHNVLIVKGERRSHENYEWTKRPRYLGAFILAWSRYMLDNIITLIQPDRRAGTIASLQGQCLYGDTDSLLIHSSRIPYVTHMFGSQSGQLSDDLNQGWAGRDHNNELRFAKVVHYVCGAPKSYMVEAVVPPEFASVVMKQGTRVNETTMSYKKKSYRIDCESKNVFVSAIKLKGIIQSGFEYVYEGQTYKQFTYSILKDVITNDKQVKVLMRDRILRNGLNVSYKQRCEDVNVFTIQRRDLERTLFKTKWKGRQHLAEGYTVPWGWNVNCNREDLRRYIDLCTSDDDKRRDEMSSLMQVEHEIPPPHPF